MLVKIEEIPFLKSTRDNWISNIISSTYSYLVKWCLIFVGTYSVH